MLRIFERRMLRTINGPIKENGVWRSRYNHILYKLYNESDIVKVIKVGLFRWLGQFLDCRSRTLAGIYLYINHREYSTSRQTCWHVAGFS
jgi:hypothetical protein